MRKHLLAVALLSLLNPPVSSQSLSIVNQTSGDAVPYAHVIGYQNDSIVFGDYSDLQGRITISESLNFDSIVFSCMGFVRHTLIEFPASRTVFLEKNILVMDEIVVYSNSNPTTKTLGYEKTKRRSSSVSTSAGFQMVALIENPFQTALEVSAIHFHYKTAKTIAGDYVLRVVAFKNDNGKPGVSVPIDSAFLVSPSPRFQEKTVSLLGEGILLPKEGLFMGVETIGNIENDTLVTTAMNAFTFRGSIGRYLEGLAFSRFIFYSEVWVNYNNPEYPENHFIPEFRVSVFVE
ncbi:MAG: hypothetical protein LAT76_12595, partial [Schleiferiaceae bacterium]|nr:hypothetical protein [Schleiferiaceae bacterium]